MGGGKLLLGSAVLKEAQIHTHGYSEFNEIIDTLKKMMPML